jgi:AcrR family transcriptional regulator
MLQKMATKPQRKPQPKPKEDTRDLLMAAATHLFAKHGFDGTSVKELADAAGVNVSLVSYHFGGKEHLYRACLQQFGEGRLVVAQRLLQKPQKLDELKLRLEMFAEEMFTCYFDNREVIQILHRECDMGTPVAQDVFRETFLKIFSTLIEFFQSAQKKKLIRRELDPQILAQSFFGILTHITRSNDLSEKLFGHSLRDPAHRRKLVDQIVSFFIFGCHSDGNPA